MPRPKLINTIVITGVASPNRNQAIIHGGKEIEMSLIVAGARREAEPPSSIGHQPTKMSKTMSVDGALNVDP